MSAVGWKLVYGGRTPPPGAVVRPAERLSSLRMAGLGAQHVVAMFGATFVFPAIMGLSPNLAVLMSGIATILFLLIVSGKVPSYLGTSASFVAAVEAIRAQGGNSADVTGAILIAWIADQFSTVQSCSAAGKCMAVPRIDWSGVASAPWIGLPKTVVSPTFGPLTGPHLPAFKATFVLLVIPSVIALLAENAGHVKAVSEMTGDDLDPYLGRAFIGDGIGTALASAVGGSPTTTYAENIGVMAATRVYSTLAYYIAATVAILFGFCPKFGAVVAATPGGVLGGITLVLYGMIGLLGAKIWVENRVNFADPVNLVPLAAGIIAGIGNLTIKFTSTFSITGIAAGTLMVLIGYHGVRPFARRPPDPSPVREGGYAGGAPPVTARESRRSQNRERPRN
jgi:xanthine/uracil permease